MGKVGGPFWKEAPQKEALFDIFVTKGKGLPFVARDIETPVLLLSKKRGGYKEGGL